MIINAFLRILASSILCIAYLLIFTGTVDWFPSYYQTQVEIFNFHTLAVAKALTGIFLIYSMAIASLFLISFSHETHKIFMGFFLAMVTFGIFASF